MALDPRNVVVKNATAPQQINGWLDYVWEKKTRRNKKKQNKKKQKNKKRKTKLKKARKKREGNMKYRAKEKIKKR